MQKTKINAARRLAVAARKKEQIASDCSTGEEASKAKDQPDLKQIGEGPWGGRLGAS